MKRLVPVAVVVSAAIAAWAAGGRADSAVSRAVPAASQWARAIEMPGPKALHRSGGAEVSSVSCGAPGDCAAGGFYRDGDRHRQGFVAAERNGVWAKAIEVPGLGTLNKGVNAQVVSVSCGAPGDCAAGGFYGDGSAGQGFVATERNGHWAKAIEVPGLGALNKGGDAEVASVSCALAGGCAAGGAYTDGQHHSQGFVVSQTG